MEHAVEDLELSVIPMCPQVIHLETYQILQVVTRIPIILHTWYNVEDLTAISFQRNFQTILQF